MVFDAAHPVEAQEAAAVGRLAMHPGVGVAVDMGNGQPRGVDAFALDDRQLLEDQRAELGVAVQRRRGFLGGIEHGQHHLAVSLADGVVAGAELGHAAPEVGAVHPLGELRHDMVAQLGAAFGGDPVSEGDIGAGHLRRP